MEGIFTLPYSEYEAMNQMKKKLGAGNSFYIPMSRQQKGIDFIIHNDKTNKILRIQVKSSRSYQGEIKKLKSGKIKEDKYRYYLWLNNFLRKCEKGLADYYVIFGIYPIYQQDKNIKSKKIFWKPIVLCFSEDEMLKFLRQIRTKRDKKPDKFFYFGFDGQDNVFAVRGFEKDMDCSDNLLNNKAEELKDRLEK